jgi:hypothetical protein
MARGWVGRTLHQRNRLHLPMDRPRQEPAAEDVPPQGRRRQLTTRRLSTSHLLRTYFALRLSGCEVIGVNRVQLLVNGKVAATDTKAGYSFKLNPKKYGKKFTRCNWGPTITPGTS